MPFSSHLSKLEPVDPQPMVNWYSPGQLALTGTRSFISNIFGEEADRRIIEALGPTQPIFDCTKDSLGRPFSEITVDYISDTGDGWNSTYAVAYWAAQARLSLKGKDLPRGDVMILGGDEVYPTPSKQEYSRRLVAPYETALAFTDQLHPRVFAVPGNHDWYDGLVSFTRLFLHRRWFAGWKVEQLRSYFVVRLPCGWWLVGTDIQLGTDIDFDQVNYFKDAARQMGKDDRIILCNAMPLWIYNQELAQLKASEGPVATKETLDKNLDFLTDSVFGGRVWLQLAGDLHHYRRHASPDGRQKITAGGGGAFLHPTHTMSDDPLDGGYEWKKSFPDKSSSRALSWRNLSFPIHHPGFGMLLGVLYVLTAWSAMADIGTFGITQWREALRVALTASLASPVAPFWGLTLLVGIFFFTDTRSRIYRFFAGGIHGVAHVAATFAVGWWSVWFAHQHCYPFKGLRQLLLSGGAIFAGGLTIGSFIFGLYLLISINVFGRHRNEAFSSLALEDWKSFLRLTIASDGTLTIFPIGFKRVPRRWKKRGDDLTKARMDPDDPAATQPELIEPPIVIPGPIVIAGGGN